MKTNAILSSLTRTFGRFPAFPVAAAAAANLFGGGSRRRSRSRSSSAYLFAGGALAAAAATVLFNPWNGRELRSRAGKLFGGGLGKLVGGQVGAHPLRTANAVRKTEQLLGSHE
jgi:hypothetical protein